MFHSGRTMSLVTKTSGGDAGSPAGRSEKKAVRAHAASSLQASVENEVAFQTADGVEWRARLARLTRHVADV
jgi:hypothetical protein